ncbi:MAG: tetratricopeptide repeat protein [Rhodanobacter sp.]
MITLKRLPFSSCCLSIGFALFLGAGQASAGGVSQTSSDTTTTPQLKATPRQGPIPDADWLAPFVYGTPAADGRPGEYYFLLGARAVKHKDYKHAMAMYKVAASWAFKPAEYNLGVMYLRGQSTLVDMPRALAWMTLAAERNDPKYVEARNLFNGHLTDAQFKEANAIMAQLLPTYGDKVALARAKARWREVLASSTCSRVGSAACPGTISVGAGSTNLTANGTFDYYQPLRESTNPYDPKFVRHYDVTGTVTVGPLIPIRKDDSGKPATSPSAPSPSDSNH